MWYDEILTWSRIASSQWISRVTLIAGAQRGMIDNIAFGILSARSWTWINAFIIDTSAIMRTIAVHNTFWTTFIIRISVVFW